ncbi:hypothetical protein D0865_12387 [Hortaea werneckii]|uniref:Methyltransferase domain-containing protein n=1 Tax=Hortaea werneckii TaxID=91943 RepID=A0A3M7BMS1_HORWE|nr:hypothetical protein D0865_12387 [Hortaea werneckii]
MLARQSAPVQTGGRHSRYERSSDMGSGRVPVSSLITAETPNGTQDLRLVGENGRKYWLHQLQGLAYPFPHDVQENDRLDQLCHLIHNVALGTPNPARLIPHSDRPHVLDVGYGTGSWLYDMSDKYPKAHLVGIDTAPTRERDPEPSKDMHFLAPVDFESDDWGVPEGSFDLINMSQLCGSVRDWDRLCRRALRYLAPGTGRIQLIEIDWEPCCDDGTLPDHSPMHLWWRTICHASALNGRSIQFEHRLPRMLEQAGFEIEQNFPYTMQTWEDNKQPSTPDELRKNQVARWCMSAMGWSNADRDIPRNRCFAGLSMALFTKIERWQPAHVELLQDDLCKIVFDMNIHLYWRL